MNWRRSPSRNCGPVSRRSRRRSQARDSNPPSHPDRPAPTRPLDSAHRRPCGSRKRSKGSAAPTASPNTARPPCLLPTSCNSSPMRLKLLGTRDRALALVGYAGGLRRSELAALQVRDLKFTDAGATAIIRRSKGDGRKVVLPGCTDLHYPPGTVETYPQSSARWYPPLETNKGARSLLEVNELVRDDHHLRQGHDSPSAGALAFSRYARSQRRTRMTTRP